MTGLQLLAAKKRVVGLLDLENYNPLPALVKVRGMSIGSVKNYGYHQGEGYVHATTKIIARITRKN